MDYEIYVQAGHVPVLGCACGKFMIIRTTTGRSTTSHLAFGEISQFEAFYKTIIAALEALPDLITDEGGTAAEHSISVRCHNQVVVNQINGEWQVRKPNLIHLCSHARQLLQQFREYEAVWKPGQEIKPIIGELSPVDFAHLVPSEQIQQGKARVKRTRRGAKQVELVEARAKEVHYTITFDGGLRGDGTAYGSFKIDGSSLSGSRVERLRFENGVTSQGAEWLALQRALDCLVEILADAKQSPSELTILIKGDAKVVLQQVAGRAATRVESLMQLRDQINGILDQFANVLLIWQGHELTEQILGH